MKKVFRDNGLSIVLISLFLIFWVGQAATGYLELKQDSITHNRPPISFAAYLSSSHFLEATFENWESEFLQMGMYVLLTAWLFQRGSAESNDPDEEKLEPEREPDDNKNREAPAVVKKGGWMLKLYEHSLSLALLSCFALSWIGHAVAGSLHLNEEQKAHGEALSSLSDYIRSSTFWFESFQNWQSEFLAVASIVILSIWLRERGSPESKSVEAAHSATGD